MSLPALQLSGVRPQAKVIAGVHVRNGLHRFQAELSHMTPGWQDAVEAALGGSVKLGVTLRNDRHVTDTSKTQVLDGWCVLAQEQRIVQAHEVASTIQEMGLVQTARNMYMDEDEAVWHISKKNGEVVITKDANADDIGGLLEKASRLSGLPTDGGFRSPLEVTQLPAKVLYVSDDGNLKGGIVHSMLEGTPQLASCLATEERMLKKEPIVIHPLQVVVAEHWEGMPSGNKPKHLNKYRLEISSEPDLLASLHTVLEGPLVHSQTVNDDSDERAQQILTMAAKPVHWQMGDRIIAMRDDDYHMGTVVNNGSNRLSVIWDADGSTEKVKAQSKYILGRAAPQYRAKQVAAFDAETAMSFLESAGDSTGEVLHMSLMDNVSQYAQSKAAYIVAVTQKDRTSPTRAFTASLEDADKLPRFSGSKAYYLVVNDDKWRKKYPALRPGARSVVASDMLYDDLRRMIDGTIMWSSKDRMTGTREVASGEVWIRGTPPREPLLASS